MKVFWPSRPTSPNTPVGELTPLIAWRGGFWFARRITPAQGRRLDVKLRRARKVRARARVIHIHHKGAFPRRAAFDRYTQAQAVNKAGFVPRFKAAAVKALALAQKLASRSGSDGGDAAPAAPAATATN